jgi:hypothetical protein
MIIYPCQISEVVNHMKDLIEFTSKNNLGPLGMHDHARLSIDVFSFHLTANHLTL